MKPDESLEKSERCVDQTGTNPSGGFFEFDDRKMLASAMVTDNETEGDGITTTRFEPRHQSLDTEKHVHGYASTQPLMGSVLVVPVHEERQFFTHGLWVEGDEDTAGAFMFHGADDTFDHSDAAVLTDGAESLCDFLGLLLASTFAILASLMRISSRSMAISVLASSS